MHQIDILGDLVIVLGSAVIVVAFLRRLRVPTIAGFILAGAIVGPSALQLVDSTKEVNALAEIGVVLLLFGVGIELSLERVRRLWKVVLLGGGLQVFTTVAVTATVCVLAGMDRGVSVFLGCVLAVSSTAVVLRGLAKRGELESPHGRVAVGMLVFQDLSVVLMILALPFLAGQGGSLTEALKTLGYAVMVLAGVLLAAKVVVPRLLTAIAATRERELFVLTVFLVCFGIAWVVSLAGISLALGAFLAGLVVASSEYRHQALSELIPARELLASLFFVSVGMLLDLGDIAAHLAPILLLLATIVVGKFLIVLATVRTLGLPLRVSVLTGAALCQVGEFSFVLLNSATEYQLLSPTISHNLLVAIVLSMLLTPLIIAFGPLLAKGAASLQQNDLRNDRRPRSVPVESYRNHVVVVGYGMCGRAVCDSLRETSIPYVVADINPHNVGAANSRGDRAILGDVTEANVLTNLRCSDARLVVLGINDTRAAEAATKTIRQLAPNTRIIARANYELERDTLVSAGASRIVTSEAAASEAVVQHMRALLQCAELKSAAV